MNLLTAILRPYLAFCKWVSMTAILFWMTVYLLSSKVEDMQGFVYVNF